MYEATNHQPIVKGKQLNLFATNYNSTNALKTNFSIQFQSQETEAKLKESTDISHT